MSSETRCVIKSRQVNTYMRDAYPVMCQINETQTVHREIGFHIIIFYNTPHTLRIYDEKRSRTYYVYKV